MAILDGGGGGRRTCDRSPLALDLTSRGRRDGTALPVTGQCRRPVDEGSQGGLVALVSPGCQAPGPVSTMTPARPRRGLPCTAQPRWPGRRRPRKPRRGGSRGSHPGRQQLARPAPALVGCSGPRQRPMRRKDAWRPLGSRGVEADVAMKSRHSAYRHDTLLLRSTSKSGLRRRIHNLLILLQ